MKNSKLIHFISKLSKQDLRQFRDFVHSPYFNKHEKTRALADYLLSFKNLPETAPSKVQVFEKIFPGQPYESQLLSNVISYLLRLLAAFYAQKESEKAKGDQYVYQLRAALDAGQQKLFSLSLKKAEKELLDSTLRDSAFYRNSSELAQLTDEFDLKFGRRDHYAPLMKAFEDFDVFCLGEKLRMACEMLARRQVTGGDYTFSMLSALVRKVEDDKERFAEIPSVWLYFLIYKLITENDDKYFYDLKVHLKSHIDKFKHREARDLYTLGLNHCVQRINLGDATFRKEAFDIYQEMLHNGLLYADGVLPQWDYTNIVSLGCELGEYTATEKFIFTEKTKLSASARENTFTYNLAAMRYAQKDYDAAVELLQKVEFTDVYYNLLNRILLIKIYFEKRDNMALEYSLETFRIYLLRNKKINEARRRSALNFIRFTKNAAKLRDEKEVMSYKDFQQKVNALSEKINKTDAVPNRNWLAAEVNNLK